MLWSRGDDAQQTRVGGEGADLAGIEGRYPTVSNWKKGTKIPGERRLLSRADFWERDKNYEVKIYFSTLLPSDLFNRIVSTYSWEVCRTLEEMHIKYAEVTSTIITLNVYTLPGVGRVSIGRIMDLLARDLLFEGWPVTKVEIYGIIPRPLKTYLLLVIIASEVVLGIWVWRKGG